jgi:hypothetical protein
VWRASFLLASLALPVTAGVVSTLRGESLYHGAESLSGRIRGHDDMLPPQTVVCANCHDAVGPARPAANPAPRIDPALLLDRRERRHGPPSRYDQPAFCRLLRTGSDPATVLISRTMPVYDVTDDQCASLWVFLTTPDGAHDDR